MKKTRQKSGMSLVEVIIAVAIFSIIIGAIGEIYVMGVKSYKHSSINLEAQRYAAVILENFSRNLRLSNYVVEPLSASTFPLPSYTNSSPPFERYITYSLDPFAGNIFTYHFIRNDNFNGAIYFYAGGKRLINDAQLPNFIKFPSQPDLGIEDFEMLASRTSISIRVTLIDRNGKRYSETTNVLIRYYSI